MSIESIAGIGGTAASSGTSAFGYGVGLGNMDNAQMTRGVTDTATIPPAGVGQVGGVRGTAAPEAATAGDAGDFASLLSGGLDRLQGMQSRSDDLAIKAATGNLTNVHDYMIASNEVQLATQLTVAVRNKAVEAFNEIMRMQI
ncbi:flagellar hook-basal body complex protein FliE [Kineococcus xinjiangensis]|uniref:Flagellar hook-basal body complex protein FliE n=1 Tax=Kineococcus xinjiangensis TaxID=512762 RepID=A0A2S6IK22_9ACTN|nr:flagellar hook-basal body complex protein FliE [Kineococcus xinjiangensis]PPK94510.1 flagellar hook-basal body complex protein FliE [Kineococcus xinjiangensis]